MNLHVSTTFIAVHDHDAALAFYHDVLGLEIRQDVKFEGNRWVTIGSASQPELGIVLEPPAVTASPADSRVLDELLAKGLLRGVIFTTDDVDALFERVQASGAEVVQEPMDQFYGVRDCAFRDPSGNQLRFNQPLKQPMNQPSST
ncbi:MAG: VOC family protein [Candidatus Eremiobacteraeota bacterium]|nr:VOC family protein [Candidatus Eremiobacteraeota bacterium]